MHLELSIHKLAGKWVVLGIIRGFTSPKDPYAQDSRVFKVGLYDSQAQAICESTRYTLKAALTRKDLD